MSNPRDQERHKPVTRSVTHANAGGKGTKVSTTTSTSRGPAAPAPKPTASTSQSRPKSPSQPPAKSGPASHKVVSSTTSDADKNLKRAAHGLLEKLKTWHGKVKSVLEYYRSEDVQTRKKNHSSSNVMELTNTLKGTQQEIDNASVKLIMDVLSKKAPQKADICPVLVSHYIAEVQLSAESRKVINLVQAEFDIVKVRIGVYQDLFTLIDRLINCTNWLIELLEGKVQPPKETFNAQDYWTGTEKITRKLKGLFTARMYLETKILEERGSLEEQFSKVNPELWSPITSKFITMIETRMELKTIYQMLLAATSKDRMSMTEKGRMDMDKIDIIIPRILQSKAPELLTVDKIPID